KWNVPDASSEQRGHQSATGRDQPGRRKAFREPLPVPTTTLSATSSSSSCAERNGRIHRVRSGRVTPVLQRPAGGATDLRHWRRKLPSGRARQKATSGTIRGTRRK